MKTLADEILEALPALMVDHERGPQCKDIALALSVGEPFAREACKALDADGRALYVRWPDSKAFHLIPPGFLTGKTRACKWCRVVFTPKHDARCCCRTHTNQWTWSQPEVRAKREAGLKATARSPTKVAALTAHNERRWSDPAQREALSEQNRREWSDPVKAAQRAAAIQAVHGRPEKRKAVSERRKRDWETPGYREKCSAAMKEAKNRPEVRAKLSESMKARWADGDLREKYTAAKRARSHALAEARRGKPQSPEQIAKRVESSRRTREAKKAEVQQ